MVIGGYRWVGGDLKTSNELEIEKGRGWAEKLRWKLECQIAG